MIYSTGRWTVVVTRKAAKQLEKLSRTVQEAFDRLAKELEVEGPVQAEWTNFGRLRSKKNVFLYHCHIKKGRPTYVACWQVKDKKIRLMEIYYVGSHENAPY